ncbi:NB-ARC domain-containing disease resistance protein [Prunus dulcis]|uniref:NB-ARC domain-containing disease resistance protein n=1 Tax=Prunus dulcis TaxID=3755 RepID=A0A5H2XNX7_PRUDU|nr:NB-ARC domain-containing disease resistance protein [Prunus dulcis]
MARPAATTGRLDLRRGYHQTALAPPSFPDPSPPLDARNWPETGDFRRFSPELLSFRSPSILNQIVRVRTLAAQTTISGHFLGVVQEQK